MANTAPWTQGDVELRQDSEGSLYLEKATDKSDQDMVFTTDAKGLAALWATILGGNVAVLNKSLVLYGKELGESGFPIAVEADDRKAGKKDPSKEYGHAYLFEQVKGFKPQGLNMRYSYIMRCPQLWAFEGDFKLGFASTAAKPRTKVTIKRVDPATPPKPQRRNG